MAQTLQAVFTLSDRYSSAIARIMKSQDDFTRKQALADQATAVFNKRMADIKSSADTAGAGVNGLVTKIGGLVSAAYLGKKALEGMFSAVNLSALQKVQETTFQALTHSDQIGSQLYAYVSRYAEKSALGREDVAQGVTSALTVTRDLGQIEQFIKMIERLYAKDPTKGAQQAVFSLKELLAGDVVSARGVYGITGVSGDYIRKLTGAGDIQGAFDYISASLDKFGATQEVVDRNFTGLTTQTNVFTSNLKTAIGEAATPVMNQLAVTMQRLNANLDAGKYQPFISVMVNGMQMIGNGVMWVADNANWLIPVLGALVGGLLIYKTVMTVVAGVTAVVGMVTAATTMSVLQFLGVVAAVAGAGAIMANLSKSVDASIAGVNFDSLPEALSKTEIPVEVSNTAPISVKGEVEIESESLRYFADFANAKFLAMYSTSMIQPQMIVENQTINENADWDEGYERFGDMIAEQAAGMPKGDYST